MRRRVFLLIWILGILFPIAWIGRSSPGFNRYFETVFALEWVHAVMHVLLYAGLANLILFSFDWQPTLKSLGSIVLIALVLGVIQEVIQQISGNIPYFRWNSLLDLGVDLGGALLGFGAAVGFSKLRGTY